MVMTDGDRQKYTGFNGTGGLTKREYFASQICMALCANPSNSTLEADEQIAFVAVQQADMLIDSLNYRYR